MCVSVRVVILHMFLVTCVTVTSFWNWITVSCLCHCVVPCAGKNNSPWMFGESGVPGSDRRWRPVSDDCLMIWDTVRDLGCGESPKNTGFSCPCASLERDRQRFNENTCLYLFKS